MPLRAAAAAIGEQRAPLLAGLALAVLIAAVVAMAAFANVAGRMGQMRAAIDEAFAADDAFVALVDQETGVRGYVATGDPAFLQPYRDGLQRYRRYSATRTVLRDSQATAALRDFRAAAPPIERYFSDELRDVRDGHRSLAAARLRDGKVRFDRLRAAEARLEQTLRGQIDRNRQLTRNAFLFDEVVIGAMIVLVVAGGFGATVLAGRGRIDALLARRDPVTALGNRRAFEERLENLIAAGAQRVGVCYIDLDGFKPINDRLGHAAGDELLAACGARIARLIRPADFVGRIGGDEFAVIVATPGADVDAVCRRISAALERPFTIAAAEVRLGASVGHAMYPDDARGASAVVRAADEAMYREKRARRAGR